LVGKTLEVTATPKTLYEFAGWATSAENAENGTYVSTDATYSYQVQASDADAGVNLIACFKYTGVYYEEDFSSYDASCNITGFNDITYADDNDTKSKNLQTAMGFSSTNTNRAAIALLASNSDGTTSQEKVLNLGNIYSGNYSTVSTIALPTTVSSDGTVKVAYKIRLGVANNKDHTFNLTDNSGTVLFGFKIPSAGNYTPVIGEESLADITPTTSANGKIDFRGDTSSNKGFYNATNWLSVEATIDFSSDSDNVTLTVKDLTAGTTLVDAVTGTTSAKDISKFVFNMGNAFTAIAIDDIAITAVANE
jgi:hypothetical protein